MITAAVLVGVDQWSKYEAMTKLGRSDAYPLIKNVLYFWYSENAGAAFGILQGKHIFFFIITIAVLIGILYLLFKLPNDRHYLPLLFCGSLIFAGAIGNFIDRVVRNYVVDFIYFKPINFPVFNVADIYITISVLLVFILLTFIYK